MEGRGSELISSSALSSDHIEFCLDRGDWRWGMMFGLDGSSAFILQDALVAIGRSAVPVRDNDSKERHG